MAPYHGNRGTLSHAGTGEISPWKISFWESISAAPPPRSSDCGTDGNPSLHAPGPGGGPAYQPLRRAGQLSHAATGLTLRGRCRGSSSPAWAPPMWTGDIYGIPTCKVEEFSASGTGCSGPVRGSESRRGGDHGHRHRLSSGPRRGQPVQPPVRQRHRRRHSGRACATSWWAWSASARSRSWRPHGDLSQGGPDHHRIIVQDRWPPRWTPT